MKVLYDWLKEFVDVTLPPAELRSRLSLSGTAIEGLEDTPAGPMLDADLTINRPDLLGHYGMAREVATLERSPLRALNIRLAEIAERAESATRVDIECPELCGRYTARVIRGVKVGPSPEPLRRRLEALGQASINNVVDATNYVMLELGHPMHAFDLERLAERRIIVRRARAGEKMRTLDGIERALTTEMCVIGDAAHAMAIGGIMGGADSEIDSTTRNVLLESAWFDPISIRRTSKALGLRTEASLRFERGADIEMAELASRRCAALIHEVAGGEILTGVVDVYPGRGKPLRIELSRKELLRVMGSDVPDPEVEAILGGLGFTPGRVDSDRDEPGSPLAVWECTQPSWRQEVARSIDLVEEVARHYGFDKFPARLPAARQPAARLPYAEAEDRLRERLIGLGYREIVTIPLVNEEEDALFRPRGDARVPQVSVFETWGFSDVAAARVANPLAADASVLRSNGMVSMARALAWNLNRGQHDARLFEIGRAYAMRNGEPLETPIATIGATGAARQKGVAESERPFEFADLKGDLDQVGGLAGTFAWASATSEVQPWANIVRSGEFRIAANLGNTSSGLPLGTAGEVAKAIADRFKIRQPAFLAEFSLAPYYAAVRTARASRHYQPISRFPAVERDFSLVLNDGTSFAAVRASISALNIVQIASIEAVDLFRGKNVPAGKFSLLVRVSFQSLQGTLTEAEVNEFSAKIIAALESQLGAALRSF